MKTHFAVFNDRSQPMNLQVQDVGAFGVDGYIVLQCNQMQIIEMEIPEGTIPYFKVWDSGQAILSYMEYEQDTASTASPFEEDVR